MSRPRLLDLACGSGSVSIGYDQAGFDVMGVDIKPQPHYPFPFLQADMLTLARMLPYFDAIHASPPCLKDTELHQSARREQAAHGRELTVHPDLITPTRAMLRASGKPYVIENVMGAPLLEPVVFNGFMFGLHTKTSDGRVWHLERERKFETNWPLSARSFARRSPIIGVYGGHVRCRSAKEGGRGTIDFQGEEKPRLMREAMGIPEGVRMTMAEISQAVPPAYSREVGRQLLCWLDE